MSAVDPLREQHTKEQLYAVLIPIGGDTLLVPNLAIAEVTSGDSLQLADGPEWFSGMLPWQGSLVPVMKFELLNHPPPDDSRERRQRIVVLHAADRRFNAGLFGIVAQAYPQLVTLNRGAVVPVPLRNTDRPEFVAARARIGIHEVAIPNLPRLEYELAGAASALSA